MLTAYASYTECPLQPPSNNTIRQYCPGPRVKVGIAKKMV